MNIIKLVSFQLLRHKKHLIIWTSVVTGMLFMYMILFPFIQEIGQAKLDALSEEILKMFGMDGFNEFTNFVAYYGVMLRMINIAITVFSVLFMGGLIYKEEKEKTIEFYANLPVSRKELLLSKLIVGVIGLFLVSFSGFIGVTLAGLINGGETYVFIDTLKIYLLLSLIPLMFGLISFGLAALNGKYNFPGITLAVVFGIYFIGYIGAILEDKGTLLTFLSPFEQLSAKQALSFEVVTWIPLLVYLATTTIVLVVGYIHFLKRDYIL